MHQKGRHVQNQRTSRQVHIWNWVKLKHIQCRQQFTTVIAVGFFRVFSTVDPAKLHDNQMKIVWAQLMLQSQVHRDVLK